MQDILGILFLYGPEIIVIGLVIAILFIVVGFREKEDFQRKSRYIRFGGILLGAMFVVPVLIAYVYFIILHGYTMTLQLVIIVTWNLSIGGLIIGASVYYPIRQKESGASTGT